MREEQDQGDFSYAQYKDTLRDFVSATEALAEARRDLFKTTRRAPAVWRRFALWSVGIFIGSCIKAAITGDFGGVGPMWTGMLLATIFVYFDPPPIHTTHRLSDSDGSPEGEDACGSVHDSAGPKDIAHGEQP